MAGSRTVYVLSAVLLAGAALATGATALRSAQVADASRAAARPLLLPFAWARHQRAFAAGDPQRLLATSRMLAELLPNWLDGRVQVAWTLAYDLVDESPTAADAADRLLRAVAFLDEAAAERRAAGDAGGARELLVTAAAIVEDRTTLDPEIGSALAASTGRTPVALAVDLLRRAQADAPSHAVAGRLGFAASRLLAQRLRAGDLRGAERLRRLALERLRAMQSPEVAARTIAGLEQLGQLDTLGSEPGRLRRLRDDPEVVELLGETTLDALDAALAERRRPPAEEER